MPNVPTISESGYKRLETSQWWGLLAPAGTPAGTPAAIVEQLQLNIVKILQSKEGSKRMLDDGAKVVGNSLDDFRKFIRLEQERWTKVVIKAKISID